MNAVLGYLYEGVGGACKDASEGPGGELDGQLGAPSDANIALAGELLFAADCFGLDHLKEWVEARVVGWEIIAAANVAALATHAHAARASQLLAVCVHCLRRIPDAAQATEGWALLPPDVLLDVIGAPADVTAKRSARGGVQHRKE
jgi:hypothetical protein